MSILVNYNGVTYTIPQYQDEDWGPEVTSYLVALATGALTRSGGLFTLLDDVDFGGTFGLYAGFFASGAANPATTGVLRLTNSDGIYWRNSTNTADLGLTLNASNELEFNGVVIGGEIKLPGLGFVYSNSGGPLTYYTSIPSGSVSVPGSNGDLVIVNSNSPVSTPLLNVAGTTLTSSLQYLIHGTSTRAELQLVSASGPSVLTLNGASERINLDQWYLDSSNPSYGLQIGRSSSGTTGNPGQAERSLLIQSGALTTGSLGPSGLILAGANTIGPTKATATLLAGTDSTDLRAAGLTLTSVASSSSVSITGYRSATGDAGAEIRVGGTTSGIGAGVELRTNNTARLSITANGAWTINGTGGNSGQFLRSQGGSSTPVWGGLQGTAPATPYTSQVALFDASGGIFGTNSLRYYNADAFTGYALLKNELRLTEWDGSAFQDRGQIQSNGGILSIRSVPNGVSEPSIAISTISIDGGMANGSITTNKDDDRPKILVYPVQNSGYAGPLPNGAIELRTGLLPLSLLYGDLNITSGEWNINGNPGTATQVLTSQGPGLPPIWAAGGGGGGSGTVTSVAVTAPAGRISVSGSPITTSGTIVLDVNQGALNLGSIGGVLDLSTQAGGNLSVNRLNSGTGASSATYWRGDGTWATPPSNPGTVTSVSVAGTAGRITSSGSPVTSSGTITVDLDTTAVTPGTYTNANITVDAYGRLTAASNGSAGGVTSFNTRTGAVTLTSSDVTTALGFTPGTGTVTSVGATAPSGRITVSGSPITTSGSFTLDVNESALSLSAIGGVLDLSTQAGGNLSVNRLNSGTGASSATYWRGDGTWATPPSNPGTVTSVGATSANAAISITGSPITSSGSFTFTANTFTSVNPGVVPASGGGTSNYLRADGTWATPPGGGGGGDTISPFLLMGA